MRRKSPDKSQPTAYAKAVGLLSRREQSERELKRKLAASGYAADEAGMALDRLKSQKFQDDVRFAGVLVRTRISQGYGLRRIAFELRSHGVSEADAAAAMAEEAPDWAALAVNLYRRRFGSRPAADAAERARRAGFLLRRGFDAATVRSITHADDVDDGTDDAFD